MNLVTNGGFESGFASWTYSGTPGTADIGTGFPHSGTNHAAFGEYPGFGNLSQTLTTSIGESYTLSFWLFHPVSPAQFGQTPNGFNVSWNGSTLSSFTLTDAGPFAYTNFTVSGLVATSTSTTLQFGFSHRPNYWVLDDVSVTAGPLNATGVPDSGFTWVLFAVGLAALAMIRRRIS
ncbi:MAG: VPDSG-CTERM sorting domain-containing protein [Opitutaceae bacterium]|nr:VPDSG-CTERM sorting domain-containing protein [Opitutaceae bacterium]